MIKNTIIRIILICFICMIILLFLELIIRVIYKDKINLQYISANLYKDKFYSDSTGGWRPNTKGSACGKSVNINSLGLRGKEIDLNSNKEKILLLGNSILFGPGVDDSLTIAGIMQKRLNSCIINTGVVGYNISNYIDVLNYWIKKTSINKVLLFYCLNDVYKVQYIETGFGNIGKYILSFLKSKSKLYMFIKNIVSDRSRIYFLYDEQYYKKDNLLLNNALNNIYNLYNICNENKIKFTIVLLPYEYQLRNKELKEVWAPQELLIKYFEEKTIPYIYINNLGAESSKLFYLYADGMHLSAKGHKAVADIVINYLNK